MSSEIGEVNRRTGPLSRRVDANELAARALAATDIMESQDNLYSQIHPILSRLEKLVQDGVLRRLRPGVYKPTGRLPEEDIST